MFSNIHILRLIQKRKEIQGLERWLNREALLGGLRLNSQTPHRQSTGTHKTKTHKKVGSGGTHF